jgi:fucose 4-O-acetylase-like acetyltransferase
MEAIMKNRNYYFDNAKFILIIFVVLGHLLNSFIDDHDGIEALYKTIYSFHMPAFILVSGFFAKGYYKPGYLEKLTKKLLLPYLIFQMIYTIFYYFLLNKTTLSFDLFNPQWSLWFLISLFCWNIMLLGFAKFKPLTGIALSLIIALLVGYVDWISNYLSLSRTFVFFPLFLIGYQLKIDHIKRLFSPSVRIIALLCMTLVFISFYLSPDFNYKWLLGSKPYSDFETATIISMFKRLGIFTVCIIMVFSFLAFIPRKQHFFTKWGQQTLYVYLLHGFLIRIFRESDAVNSFSALESFVLLIVVAVMAVIIPCFLSTKFVQLLAQPFIELKTLEFQVLMKKITFSKKESSKESSSF